MKAKTIVLTLLISLGLCMNVNAQEKGETENTETVDSVLNSIYNKSDNNKVHIKTTYILDNMNEYEKLVNRIKRYKSW